MVPLGAVVDYRCLETFVAFIALAMLTPVAILAQGQRSALLCVALIHPYVRGTIIKNNIIITSLPSCILSLRICISCGRYLYGRSHCMLVMLND